MTHLVGSHDPVASDGAGYDQGDDQLTSSAAGRHRSVVTADASAQGIPFGALAHLVPAGSLDNGLDGVLAAMVEALAQRHDGWSRLVCIDDALATLYSFSLNSRDWPC